MAENNSLQNYHDTKECEEDGIVTMVDVLKAEEILEENADAVLGPGDDKNCTYSQGYLKRQALYSCLTCFPAKLDRAAICLACSYHCHTDHELVELYTKRNFRCDCGNTLFKGRKCTLDPVKEISNSENVYNDNFDGVYCKCKRPYPDPDSEDPEDPMIQCIICEDWYHTKHLDASVPKEDDYAEMICGTCMDKLPFLCYYLGYAVTKVSRSEGEGGSEADMSVTELNNSLDTTQELANGEKSVASETSIASLPDDKSETEDKKCLQQNTSDTIEKIKDEEFLVQVNETETSNSQVAAANLKESPETTTVKESEHKSGDEDNGCKLKNLKNLPRGKGATFWPDNFRKLLCVCTSCKSMYKENGVSYLTDEEDTIRAYEEEGKAHKKSTSVSQYELGMEALSSLDRVQQVEAILSFNEMKTHLSEYLAKFAENKKVVREEDIREFFRGMQARKRQKFDIPHNCR